MDQSDPVFVKHILSWLATLMTIMYMGQTKVWTINEPLAKR